MQLSGFESKKLLEALLAAYPSYDDLKVMVQFQLEENLEAIAGSGKLRSVIFDLIQWADARGEKLDRLIIGAYEENPDNLQLREFYKNIFEKRFVITPTAPAKDFGPEPYSDGQGLDEVQLQGFLQSETPWYDVGNLQRSFVAAASVCRIEIPSQRIIATGVLISDRLVLTNYHVLKFDESADMEANALEAILRFGCFSTKDGKETEGQVFQLDRLNPILDSSPVEKLDYVLLQLITSIQGLTDVTPAVWNESDRLEPRRGINLLQHPQGESMKLSISSSGITGVYPERGLVQYVNKTAGGSSGAPGFNEDWQLVALHHAERARSFGSIREGILFSSIYREINSYL